MGVYISLHASNKVNPLQWEKAYEESLILVDKFNLIEFQDFEKFGKKYFAAVKSKERKCPCGIGWRTVGDGNYMATAEDFFLPRKIDEPKESEKYCDPLMYILAQHGCVDFENPYVKGLRYFWDSKTQGEPYHGALLAVACLLDDRLNGEVVCGSDISYGQCKHAVEIVNKILKKKIGMPLRCRMDDLHQRVRNLPIEANQKIKAFATTYLGIKDEQYYKFVEEHFSDEEQYLFIKERMKGHILGTIGFADSIQEILSYNMSIANVCSAFLEMKFDKKKDVSDSENPYKQFIETILETNIYLPEKDLRDCLKVDANTPETMSVEKLFASFMFVGARNRSVARYIPLEDLKTQLNAALGDKCDVAGIIDNYLKEKRKKQEKGEKSSCTKLNDAHDAINKKLAEKKEKYDVSESEDFVFFKKGDSVSPEILDSLKIGVDFFKKVLKESEFAELSLKDYQEKCRFLETQNRSIKLMNSVWLKIFDDIRDNPDCFKRYYPMVRVQINHRCIHDLVRAYVENDDFYELCETLGI